MERIGTILVATDFSDGSAAAIKQAARLAKAANADLHAVHAITAKAMSEARNNAADGTPMSNEQIIEQAREHIAQALANADAPADNIHVAAGKPIAEIRAAVERTDADLLVIGATGASGVRFGTVAGRCVRTVAIDVLLVPPGITGPFETVVACVDLGASSQPVLQAAAEFARVDGASVTAVHAFEVPWERARWGGAPGDAFEQYEELEDAKLELLEREVKAATDTTGQPIASELLTSVDIDKAISEHANEVGADLVVTGTTDRSKLGYMLLGTTAEKVLRDTRGAVLAVQPVTD